MIRYKCDICPRMVLRKQRGPIVLCACCQRGYDRLTHKDNTTAALMKWVAQRAVQEFKLLQAGKKYR